MGFARGTLASSSGSDLSTTGFTGFTAEATTGGCGTGLGTGLNSGFVGLTVGGFGAGVATGRGGGVSTGAGVAFGAEYLDSPDVLAAR